MALSIRVWDDLTETEKLEVINFLEANCKIDLETPEGTSDEGYPISDGMTSGGHPMKYGEEYRIYVKSKANCPDFLLKELKSAQSPYAGRIGGSETIKAIMELGQFEVGHN